MTVPAGTRIGNYEIVAPLGAGGMGEVYRARDTGLQRDVALKVLPDTFAADPERIARFEREAHTLAALNHPHIAQVYGFERGESSQALVMELVEGEDLSQLIARGPVPLDDALPIARQIAEALEAAHDAGIIHRDLKPANIKVRPDGTVKVLDFGLAKALEQGSGIGGQGPGELANSPTITSPAQMTHAGMILGTAAYMSPEQARGRVLDRRTDVWAFGCVLFEMLTGVRAFGGDDVTETLAAIMKSEPPLARLPADTPVEIRRLLARCLQKDRRVRLQHIGDARLELDDAAHPQLSAGALSPRAVARQRWLWAGLVLVAGIGGVIGGTFWGTRLPPEQDEIRLDLMTPATDDPTSFALSPDGSTMAFVGMTQTGQQLQIKKLDGSPAVVLPETLGARQPFWSPDGRSIAFFTANKLLRIEVDGGPPRALANVLTPAGGTWNRSGTILFVPNSAGIVHTIPAESGAATPNTSSAPDQLGHRFPQFLPDGHHFVVHAGSGDAFGLYVGELGSPGMRRIANVDSSAIYASGNLFFAQDRTLFAQGFDVNTLTLTGDRRTVAENVMRGGPAGIALTGSANGLIAYRADAAQSSRRRLLWFDRRGNQLGQVGAERARASNPALSPDGRFLAIQEAATSGGTADIWTIDLVRNADTRITFDPAIDAVPTWSPDGRRLLFNSNRGTSGVGPLSNLYVKDVTSSTAETPLLISAESKFACDWSRDGRFVLYRSVDSTTGAYDLMAFAADGGSAPFAVARTQYDERDGQFSPDGSTVAFHSDESGRPEIYVQSFPEAGNKIRISPAGGTQPRWRADGEELFYIAANRKLIAVPITRRADGGVAYGAPAALFDTRIVAVSGVQRQQYVVSPDGQRFLINTTGDESTTPVITMVLNWRGSSQQ